MTRRSASGMVVRMTETLSENWFRLDRLTIELDGPDGSRKTLHREVYHMAQGVGVLLVDETAEQIVLVRQSRLPPWIVGGPEKLIEVCAGMVEAGGDPVETARREVLEETGYTITDPRRVLTAYTSPGVTTEMLHLFIAPYRSDQRASLGGGLHAEGEDIEVLEMSVDQAVTMMRAGEIIDAKTIMLLQHFLLERSYR